MFRLEESTEELFEATRAEWLNQAESLGDVGTILSADICSMLDGKEKECRHIENSHAYFLVENSIGHGCAILDIMQARPESPGSWLKILDIKLEPLLNPDARPIESSEDMKRIISVLANALVFSIRLLDSDDFAVGKLKIFGRTETMSSFFNTLLASGALEETTNPLGIAAKREGQWLIIEKI